MKNAPSLRTSSISAGMICRWSQQTRARQPVRQIVLFFCGVMNMLRKITCTLSILFLGPMLTVMGVTNTQPSSVTLIVHTHGVQLTENDLTAVLDAATGLLNHDQVNISFVLSPSSLDSNHNVIDEGNVQGCDGIKNLLKSSGDIHSLHVHIVKDIFCCDGATEAKAGDAIVGCSGPKMPLIVRPPANPGLVPLTAIEWMHEFGHNRGLKHDPCQNSIMFPIPTFTSTDLNACERLVFNGNAPSNPVCHRASNNACVGMHLLMRTSR